MFIIPIPKTPYNTLLRRSSLFRKPSLPVRRPLILRPSLQIRNVAKDGAIVLG